MIERMFGGGGAEPTKQERRKWHRLNVISSKTSERGSEVL
jgi:hypothetical protein